MELSYYDYFCIEGSDSFYLQRDSVMVEGGLVIGDIIIDNKNDYINKIMYIGEGWYFCKCILDSDHIGFCFYSSELVSGRRYPSTIHYSKLPEEVNIYLEMLKIK